MNDSKKSYIAVAILVIALIILTIGIYNITRSHKIVQKITTPQQSPRNSTSPSFTKEPTETISLSPTSKKITAGNKTQVFSPYTLVLPDGWTNTHVTNNATDTITLIRGQYQITITQTTAGAGSCNYQGETPEPMSQMFTNFVDISATFAQLRRGETDNTNYTVCEHKGSGFAFPTSIGYITYKTPLQPNAQTLTEMDNIIATIFK